MNREVKLLLVFAFVTILLSVPFGCSIDLENGSSVGTLTNSDARNHENRDETEIGLKQDALGMLFFSQVPFYEDGVSYICRMGFHEVARFGSSKIYYLVDGITFTLEFPGSNTVDPIGEKPIGSITNYLYGNETDWITGLDDYSVLRYKNLYPDIDLIFKIHDGMIKYEFIVAPYADPTAIRLRYSSVDTLVVNGNSIEISQSGRFLKDTGLEVFQIFGDELKHVSCFFKLVDSNMIAFSLGNFVRSKTLIIDPLTVVYSTFIGDSTEEVCTDIAVENGFIYLTGYRIAGVTESFIIKLASNGQSIVFSTYFGASYGIKADSIAVENGTSCVVGSGDTVPAGQIYSYRGKLAQNGQSWIYNQLQLGFFGNPYSVAMEDGYAYITATYSGLPDGGIIYWNLDPTGGSVASTSFLAIENIVHDIAVEDGFVYFIGQSFGGSWTLTFPSSDAIDGSYGGNGDCFVAKLSGDGSSIIYGTYIGGTNAEEGVGIAVEDDVAYLISNIGDGERIDTIKIPMNGDPILSNTSLNGSGSDYSSAIAVEKGIAYMTGYTNSSDFPMLDAFNPISSGGFDCFMASLSVDGLLTYSTYLGGINDDFGYGIVVENGTAFIGGSTTSGDFPMIQSYNSTFGGIEDCFVAVFSTDSDFDGLNNWLEYGYGTNPYLIDSDNDNFLDMYEVIYGSDPTNSSDYPFIPQSWFDRIYTDLDGNATLVQNLIAWSNGNASLLEVVMQELNDNATLLTQVISWLDGNHTAIESLFAQLDGNATLLISTVMNLNENATLIDNLLSWSDGNYSLLLYTINQLEENATLLTQVITWLDGNHSAIETLFTHLDGNATLLLNTIQEVNYNQGQLSILAALITGNTGFLNTLNATHFQDYDNIQDAIDEIRIIVDELGISVGDSDYDGLDDLDELALGTDLLCIDSDTDNLNDAFEVKLGTDPLNDDSDADTYLDGIEVIAGTDPLDPLSYPGASQGINPMILILAIGGVGVVVIIVVIIWFKKLRGKG